MRVLITGYEPQFGIKKTPSGEMAKLWAEKSIYVPGVTVKALVLPQLFTRQAEITIQEILAFKPHVVIMYGATQKNDPIRIERFAINVRNTTMGDNSRIPTIDTSIIENGIPAYETPWPCKDFAEILSEDGMNSIVSYNAGTHVCNDQLYLVLKWVSENDIGHPVAPGFVHMSFPNEYGVVEDRSWTTSKFPELVKASIKLVQVSTDWYKRKYGIST